MTTTDATPTTTTESGKLASSRIRDAEQGHKIYKRLKSDDELAAWQRGNIDYQIDGGLPYSDDVLRDAGRGEDTNVNFKEAKAEDDAAQTPFIEMTTVTRLLWRCRTDFGTAAEQDRFSQIISEEHTRTVREWGGGDFDFYRLRLAQQFTRHGVGFLYWENELDWRWRSDGLDAFKIPRNIESRASAIPYAICERTLTVDELYAFIRNEDRANEVGRWNVEAVKQALCSCTTSDNTGWSENAWEEFLKRERENDLALGATCPKVKIYHLWTREYNGSISHYIGLQSGACKGEGGNMIGKGFLYEHRSRFKSLDRCIIPFFYGIGTHGTIHTIRGQGELNFGPIAISNRARCSWIDVTKAATSILIQADTPNDAEGAAYVQRGPFLIFSGNTKVTPTAMPDTSGRIQPMLRDMQMLRQNVTGSYQSRAITEEGTQERTKYEVQAAQAQSGTMESARLLLFLGPWSRTGKEMFDRMMNPALREDDPGGESAWDFRKRCLKRGVPMEALESVYSVEAVRSIGYGSPEARQYSSDKIYQMSGGFDQLGQRKAKLDMIAALPGVDYQSAEEYVGPEQPRLTIDDQMAEKENALFRLGTSVPVTDGEDAWVHCQHHAQLVTETVQAFESGEIDGGQLVPILSTTLENMLGHSEQLSKDPMKQKEAGYVRKFLQENGGTLQQQEQKLIAEMQRQQEDKQNAQGEAPMDGEETRRWQTHQLEMQIKRDEYLSRRREYFQKLEQQDLDAQQARAHADLKMQADLAMRRSKLSGSAA